MFGSVFKAGFVFFTRASSKPPNIIVHQYETTNIYIISFISGATYTGL